MDNQSPSAGLRKLKKKYILDINQAISTCAGPWNANLRKIAQRVLHGPNHSFLYNLDGSAEHFAEGILAVVKAHFKYDPEFAAEQVQDLKRRRESLDKLNAAYDLLKSAHLGPKDRDVLARLTEVRRREKKWVSDQSKYVEDAQNALLRAWAPLSKKAFEGYRWDVLADIVSH